MRTRQTKRKKDIQALAEMYGTACVGFGGGEELDDEDDDGFELDEEDDDEGLELEDEDAAFGSADRDDEDDDDEGFEGSLELLDEEEGLDDEDEDDGFAADEEDMARAGGGR